MPLCHIRRVAAGPCARDRREGKVAVPMGKATKMCLSPRVRRCAHVVFAWQAWIFVVFDVFQQECVCATVVRVKLPCLWGKRQKRVFLNVSEDALMSFCVTGVIWDTPHFTLHTLHSTLYTPHFTLYTLHSTLCTPHFTLHMLHSTLHTLHFTLYTSHSTLHIYS